LFIDIIIIIIIIIIIRARLVATSNLHFDPGYGGLPQNAILLLSGMSGCHKNSIIKTL